MGSSDPLSFPSEPPDIGNWFSSYVYQSPGLDSIDDVKDCRELRGNDLGGNEDELLVDGDKALSDIVENVNSCGDNKFSSEDSGSSDYQSLPSEPPDIKNWFSGYEYESPALNHSDALIDSPYTDNNITIKEKEEDFIHVREALRCDLVRQDLTSVELVKCNDKFKESINDDQNIYKDLGYSENLSHCSEPPDINNWFSSYKYESPTLDSSDAFIISDHIDNSTIVKEHDATNSTKENEKEFRGYQEAVQCDLVGEEVTGNFNRRENDENGSTTSKLNKKRSNGDFNRRENDENGSPITSRLNKESSHGDLKRMFNLEANHGLLKINESDHSGRESPKKLITIPESIRAKQSTEVIRNATNEESSKVNMDGSNEKENNGNRFPENGFVSTRKTKSSLARDKNRVQKPLGVRSCSSKAAATDSLSTKNDALVKRKILSDTTNLQQSNILEITGKWKCPQKNKPNLGPPMKQLRLESWVCRN